MSLVLPLHRVAAEPLHRTTVRLGMPHLSPFGLSETWLLKELGDIHWQLLAARLGQPAANIADREGNRVYAAFRHVRVEGAHFAEAREDAALEVRSSLWRLSRTQVLSRHDLSLDGVVAGTVTMVSAFIRREGGVSNHRVSRVEVPGLSELPSWGEPQELGGKAPEPVLEGGFAFTPCPVEDFNGAGFLYFSSYVAIAERAAFALHPQLARGASTLERSVSYFGNLDMGEAIRATLSVQAAGAGRWRTFTHLHRASDGTCLACIATLKQMPGVQWEAGVQPAAGNA